MTIDSSKGIIQFSSPWPFGETVEKIEALLLAKKIKVFARIDQAAEAEAVGLKLRPTMLLIFGNPAAGTPLMDSYPSLALDLPLKALVCETKPSEVTVILTSPEFLQTRHQLPMTPFSEMIRLFAGLLEPTPDISML